MLYFVGISPHLCFMRKLWECVQRFGNWCNNHKAITAFVVALFVLGFPLHYTYAADSELFTKFLTNPIDVVMLTLAGIIQVVTGAIGKLILLIIQVIVIPVLGYNGFYNSHITNLGWSLVRDVVNMFVVVVLMVIAIMTIVGYSKANWTQQLPRLFIAIVLVNFSKLICGFLIDVSQVIMFTFVNAIVSIAAGNFASMLSMDSFGQLNADFIDKINATGVGMGAFEFLMGAYLQFIVMLAILGVMFLLAAAFVWRIVVLWILIIMSPMAFFLGGIKDVFGAAGKSYEEWWSKFSSALTFGPVMCFFLWLALAASSGSNLARTEDFPMPESQNDTGLQLEMFSLDNFLGMFIALAILIAGMQQASSSAQALGGFASKMLSEDMGKGLVKGIARSPFAAAGGFKKERAWMNEKAKKGGAFAETYAPAGLTKGVGNALSKTGTALSGIRGLGGLGNAVAAVGGNVVKGAKETQKENVKLGGDQFKERTDAQTAALDVAMANGTNAYNSLPVDEKNAVKKGIGTDLKRRNKFKENIEKDLKSRGMSDEDAKAGAQKKHDEIFQDSIDFLDTDEGKALMDDTEKDRLQDSKFSNLHLLKSDAERNKVWDAQEKDGRANLSTISNDALLSAEGGKFLRGKTVRQENGKNVNAWEDIAINGKGSQAQKKAIEKSVGAGNIASYSAAGTESERKSASGDLSVLLQSGRLSKLDPANPGDAAIYSSISGSKLSDMRANGDISEEDEGKARGALLQHASSFGSSADAVFGTAAGTWASIANGAASAKKTSILNDVQGAMDADPSNAGLFSAALPGSIPTSASDPVVANDVTKRIASVDVADIKKMRSDKSINPAKKAAAMGAIDTAVSVEKHKHDNKIAQAQAAEASASAAESAAQSAEAAALLARQSAANEEQESTRSEAGATTEHGKALRGQVSAQTEVTAATAARATATGAGIAAANARIAAATAAKAAADARVADAAAEIASATTRKTAATAALGTANAAAVAASAVKSTATVSATQARAALDKTTKSSTEEIKRLNGLHREITSTVPGRYEVT